MNILYIGGNGNISWWCSQANLEQGHKVWHLNRGLRQGRPVSSAVQHIQADLWDQKQMLALSQRWRDEGVYFHCIADFMCFNLEHARLRAQCFAGLTDQYIFISSASAYVKPLPPGPITENTPLGNPHWEYSRQKQQCEEFFWEQHKLGILPCTIVRPSHTYDTVFPVALGDMGYTVPRRLLAHKPVLIHDQGETLWTLTHSSDFAQAFAKITGNPATLGESYHITGDQVLTWKEIYRTLAELLEVPLNAIYMSSAEIAQAYPEMGPGLLGDKAWNAVFDNSKIKALCPEFGTKTPLKAGLAQTLAWFQEDSARQNWDAALDAWMDSLK